MDCPNCGALMQLDKGMDSWSCNYCKSVYYSQKNEDNVCVLSETSSLACPVCSVPLAEAAIDAHKLFYCTRCRGSLIPVPVFVSLLDELRAKQGGAWTISRPADPNELRQINCPQLRPPDGYALLRRSGQRGDRRLRGLRAELAGQR